MSTQQRLDRYQELFKVSQERARLFLDKNRADERFVSIIQVHSSFLAAFGKRRQNNAYEHENAQYPQ